MIATKLFASTALVVIADLFLTSQALAVCAPAPVTGGTTTCDTNGIQTATVGTGPGLNNATVNVNPNAQINSAGLNAISLGNNANITIGANATVQNNATTNGGGNFGTGRNTVEFGSNGTLTIQAGGQILSTGTANNAEAINVHGFGNRIVNNGLIQSKSGVAIWFEDQVNGAPNVIDNYGIIRTLVNGGNFNVIGNGGTSDVNFINRTGARVEGNLTFGGGNDKLTLEAGSVITGSFNGGGGTNALVLDGGAGSQDVLAGNISNFQTLLKTGDGRWTLSGTIGSNGGGTPLAVTVGQGTLALTGNNSSFNGSVTVNGPGTLEARAQSLPPTVTNNGLVRFAQPDAGTYTGLITGTGAVEKTGAGVLTLSPASPGGNTYSGGTRINQGTIAIGADSALGAATGSLTFNGGTLQLNTSLNLAASRAITVNAPGGTINTQGFNSTVSQGITGQGSLTKAGSGTLTLTGSSSYSGGTTISGGTLQLGNGGTSGSITGNVANNGALVFNRSDTVNFGGVISGTGTLLQSGSGNTVLTGTNSYAGATTVATGSLYVNGDQSAATGLTTVNNGANLGGTGTIGGSVVVADGAHLSPGDLGTIPGTLTINQNLSLTSGSILDYSFGQANIVGGAFNDLTKVKGDLVLDGTLNVATTSGGTFDPGVYRVISYSGALTNNGLNIGTIPSPNFYVQTSVANQVNLVNTNGLVLNYWDGNAGPKNNGAVNGGDGVWQNFAGNDNWTEQTGSVNAPFQDAAFAIFLAKPGNVTVDNSLGKVNVSGMQFASDGYVVNGDAITLVGAPSSIIRVGDGTSDGTGYTATINAELTGSSQLIKTDLGTLVLNHANSYTGGTTIRGGTLQVSSDNNLGAAAGGLTFDGGTLHTTKDIATSRAVNTLSTGTLLTDAGTTLTLNGPLSGAGSITKDGTGTMLLVGNASNSGSTTVKAGTLVAGGANVLSAASAYTVAANAAVDLKGYDQTVQSLSNAGLVTLGGKPGTVLAMSGGYTGNNGTIALNTVLGNDSSVTDLVKVGGDTQGTSTLKVTNIGGNGAATVNGIKVVDIAGASNATFALAGDYIFQGQQAIVAGAYGYRLYKNGVTAPTDGDWYLRSSLTNPATPPVIPPVVPPVVVPLYQPGVPLYEAYAQTLLGLNGLPTLQQRVGNRYWMGAGNAAIAQGDGPGTPEAEPLPSDGGTTRVDGRAIWTRIEAAHMTAEPKNSTSGTDYKYDIWKLQSGVDGKLYESDAGTLIGGITVHYGNVSADISSVYGTGTIDTDGYGFGGTLTWYGQNGFYADGQAQATWFDSDLKSDTAARTMADGNNGFGYAVSLEAGQRIALNQHWTLTPQAQLSYSAVDFDSFTDPFRARISLDSGDSLKGRLGLAANYQNAWADKSGKMTRTNVYGIANLYYEFLDGTQVDVSTTKFVSGNERFWGGIGAGGSYNWADDKYSIYGEVSVNTSLANFGDSYSLNGTTGFRIKW